MNNVIKSELFKSMKSVYFRICLFIGSAFIALVSVFLPEISKVIEYPITSADKIFEVLPFVFMGASIILLIFLPLFSDVFKYNTLKNQPHTIPQMPFAKYIASLVIASVYAVVFVISITITMIRLEADNAEAIKLSLECIVRFLGAIPNYMAIIAVIQLLSVAVKNEIVSAIIYYYGITQLFTIKLIITSVISENFNFVIHFTPIGELFNLGYLEFSIAHIVIGALLGIVYTLVLNKLTAKLFCKRALV